MAAQDTKKRKRDGDAGKPKKKVVIDAPASTATVTSVLRPQFCPPVVATTSGIQVPDNLTFHSYLRKDDRAKTAMQKDLLLHSTSHPRLDYTVKQEATKGSKSSLNHYLGVYDPVTGKLQLVEAKKMNISATVRARQPKADKDSDVKQTIMDQRVDLGLTFGTKKAKKAIQDRELNAISPLKKSGDASAADLDDASRAMMHSVGQITSTMASRDELQAIVDEARPVPRANLEANEIHEVYDPEDIIGANILSLVPIREWQEKVRQHEGIQVPSRYVAMRVNNVAASEANATRLRVLRYMFLVILFYLHSKPGKQRGTRQIPPREKLRELLAPAPEAVIENIRRKFSDAGQMSKTHIDLLMTHCCAFACIVDEFQVDTHDLREDLRIDQKTINTYFHEIGARVKSVKEKEQGRTVFKARLALPLDFPRQRQIAVKRR